MKGKWIKMTKRGTEFERTTNFSINIYRKLDELPEDIFSSMDDLFFELFLANSEKYKHLRDKE